MLCNAFLVPLTLGINRDPWKRVGAFMKSVNGTTGDPEFAR